MTMWSVQQGPVSARGLSGGQISFDGRAVTITRGGFVARSRTGGAGSTIVPLEQISGVDFKPVGATKGHITIVVGALTHRHNPYRVNVDPMTVEFLRHGSDFRKVRDAIEAAMRRAAQQLPQVAQAPTASIWPQPVSVPQPPTTPLPLADQLSDLARLHEQGQLTDDEFATAKARVLGLS